MEGMTLADTIADGTLDRTSTVGIRENPEAGGYLAAAHAGRRAVSDATRALLLSASSSTKFCPASERVRSFFRQDRRANSSPY